MSEARPSLNYPTSFSTISGWAQENGVGVREARLRFAQYGILRGIASSASLRDLLVFKGGNALDFIWDPNRSTLDLDFSVDMSKLENQDLVEPELEALLSRGLAVSGRDLGVRFRVHSVRRRPARARPSSPTPPGSATLCRTTRTTGHAWKPASRARTLCPST